MKSAIIKSALLGALIIGSATWLSQTMHPFWAGLISALPATIPALYFSEIAGDDMHDFLLAFSLGIVSYVFAAGTVWYLHTRKKYSRGKSIMAGMVVWACIAFTLGWIMWKNTKTNGGQSYFDGVYKKSDESELKN